MSDQRPQQPSPAGGGGVSAPGGSAPGDAGDEVLLQVQDLHTYYGDSHILQGVSVDVRAGRVVALLGRNGAGKTTTVMSIVGLIQPRSGRVLFRGRDVTTAQAFERTRAGLGMVLQGKRVFPSLTVEENLRVAATAGSWTPARAFELFPRLEERRRVAARLLSGGEQQMLSLARALVTNPSLLVLDEPSEGLAPAVVHQLGEVFLQLRAEGLALMLVEQNLPLALEVADRTLVMSKGRIVFDGLPGDLAASPEVLQQYLGV